MVANLDHIVLAVADLDSATAAYTRLLGRSPSWRGRHPAMGTRNTLFRLDNTYLELLAADPGAQRPPAQGGADQSAEPRGAALREVVLASLQGREERPFALALGVADIGAAVRAARAGGLSITDPADGAGTDDSNGVRRTWRSAFFSAATVRGLRLFLIEHTSPAERLPPSAVAGASADGVDHIVIVTQDLDASCALWTGALGRREAWRRDFPERGTRNVGIDVGGIVVELIQRSDRAASERSDVFWGIAYRAADCDPVVARMRADGFAVDPPRPGLAAGTRVATVRWERTRTLVIAHMECGDSSPLWIR